MQWFDKLGMRAKIFLGFSIMWLMLVTAISVAYLNIDRITKSEKEIHDVGLTKVLTLQQIRTQETQNRAEILEMGLTASGEERDRSEQRIAQRSEEITRMFDLLFNLEQDEQFKRRLKESKDLLAEHRKTRERQISLIHQGQTEAAQELAMGIQNQRHDKLIALLNELRRQEDIRLDKILLADVARGQDAVRVFLFLGVAAFFLGLFMVWVLNRVVAEVQQVVSHLGATASEMLTASSQVASGSAETAAAIVQTTATVEEVRQAAQLSNQKAQDVSGSAKSAAQVARDGNQAVEEAGPGMQQIRREMEAIARTIVLLSEQGQAIGGIIATVTDLADQTNLLAVNAAIEAAKAGEQGKGFAVVAQEIKSLADQSKQATGQVRTILGDIQRATSASVMATEQGGKAVEAGLKQFFQAGEAIRLLAEATALAAQASTQIVASSQQQVVGMDQIGLAMENIKQAGNDTVVSMKQMEQGAQNLNEVGQRLRKLVSGK